MTGGVPRCTARRLGQTGNERFTVLADPEGNEFCVLDGPPTR
ncbi:VOC family protein [Micromonospora sp. NPDC005194]